MLLAIPLVLASGAADADPDPAISYLMAQPVSLFTYGQEQLRIALRSWISASDFMRGTTPHVVYDYPANRLVIELDRISDLDQLTHENCRTMIVLGKQLLGIGENGSPPVTTADTSFLREYFSQDGYEDGNRPPDLGQRLDAVTVIVAKITFFDEKFHPAQLECRSDLRSASVFFTN